MTLDLEYHVIDLNAINSQGCCNPKTMARERITKKWEVFAGRNRFYCDGRLMTAPNGGVFLLTVFLITGTCTLFFIYDCKYLAENVTIAIPIIGGLLFVFTMSSLLRTSLSDPGIIPRATPEEAAYVEKQIEVTNSANSPTYRPPPRTKEVLVKGQTIKLKYCFTCKIFRPPRASHCSLCDNCVDRFDHHCPWVGNCVGRRNYRFFYMFIVSLAFLAVFIFACAIAHLILMTKEDRQFLDAVKESPPSVIVAAICFFSVWSILGLAGFHTYLTTSNQTTNEDIKGSFASKRGQENFNPYSQGNVCLNCFYILCGPVTPSLLDRRGIVTDDYRAEMSRNSQVEVSQPYPYGVPIQNGPTQVTMASSDMPGIYRQTTETTDSNAGSITHLVTNEQPLAIAPALHNNKSSTAEIIPAAIHHYASETSLNNQKTTTITPVYSNIMLPTTTIVSSSPLISKSQSYSNHLNLTSSTTTTNNETSINMLHNNKNNSVVEDLDLDLVMLSDIVDNNKQQQRINKDNDNNKLDNDLTLQEKENSLLSPHRLRLLQDTTMIESALDLDSLDDSSLGTNSQAGLMKVVV